MNIMDYHATGDLEKLIKQTNVNRWSAWVVGIMLSAIHTFINIFYLSHYHLSKPYLVVLAVLIMGFCFAYVLYATLFYRVEKNQKILFITTINSLDEVPIIRGIDSGSLYRKLKLDTFFAWLFFFFVAWFPINPKHVLDIKDEFPFYCIQHSEYLFFLFMTGLWIFANFELIFLLQYWANFIRNKI